MLKEFYRIMRASGLFPARGLGIVAGLVLCLGTYAAYYYPQFQQAGDVSTAIAQFYATAISLELVWIGTLVALPLLLIIRELMVWPRYKHPFSSAGATLFGIFYVTIPLALLPWVVQGPAGYDYRRVICLLFLIWASDIGAYVAGKTLGRHKLAPNISPGKTWEGWAGGALLTFVIAWACGMFIPDLSLTHRLVAAGVVAVFGPLGDLAESMLKRSAGVKDSGTFLPGHGGLLDRFDAFLLVLPVLALLQLLAGR